MVLTVSEFMLRHPEFRDTGDVLITRALTNAELYCSADAFGDRYAMAVEYKACALLASGMYGQISPPDASKPQDYQKQFEELRKLNPIRGLVT